MAETRQEYWSRLLREQETCRQSVRLFCRARGISEPSFYYWRKRREDQGVRFALLETTAASGGGNAAGALEVILTGGERLLIGRGVDPATLRMVVQTLGSMRG